MKVAFGRISSLPGQEPTLGRRHVRITPEFNIKRIKVDEVLTLLDAGYRPFDIMSMLPTIEENDISACIGYAATHLKDRHEYKRNNRRKSARILLDENLSPGLVGALYESIGGLSSIYYEGMDGYTDEFIYWRPWAKISSNSQHKKSIRHVIITQDMDLCDLAVGQWKQRICTSATPELINFKDTNRIILVSDPDMAAHENASFYKNLASKIMRAVFNPAISAPWYKASKTSLSPGISLQALIEEVKQDILVKRFQNGEVTSEERQQMRADRAAKKTGAVLTPQTDPLPAPV
jgi:uncharacterized protein (DUF433 family)